MDTNRFKELLESTMGDVRPLVSEQNEPPAFIPQPPSNSSPKSGGPDTLPNNVNNSPPTPTPPLPPNKTTEILPKHYNYVKQMIQRSVDEGGIVTITITRGEVKLTGIVKGNTGTILPEDLKNIIP
jgi:hypothetical protein